MSWILTLLGFAPKAITLGREVYRAVRAGDEETAARKAREAASEQRWLIRQRQVDRYKLKDQ